jgi:hypothetical protein
LRQRKVARLADKKQHGKFSSRIKMAIDATKAKAKKFADEADWIFGKRTVRVLAAVVLFAVVVALLTVFMNWYVAPTKPSAKKDLVLAVAQILAGTALLSGLYFTWRTLQVNREGQITERFTRAIEQLGKVEDGQKLFEIRVGGIYALERIAKESEEDYWPIIEILTAYVRQNSRLPLEVDQERTQDATDEQHAMAMEASGGKSETTEPSVPDPDIHAIMTILRRRKRSYMHGEPERLHLSKTNLSRANLYGANLYGVDLSGANLSGANLSIADLSVADLYGADLIEANLYGADLIEAKLSGANLSGADLTQKQLEETRSGDENTRLPSHLKPPAHWGVKTDEQSEGG